MDPPELESSHKLSLDKVPPVVPESEAEWQNMAALAAVVETELEELLF